MVKFYKQKMIKVAGLSEYKHNPRRHTPEQMQQICDSIEQFGFTNPLLIDEKNTIIAGHGRYRAAKSLKLVSVPAVVVTGLDKKAIRALGIADNKIALNAYWDESALLKELSALDNLGLVGFTNAEFEALTIDAEFKTEEDTDGRKRAARKTDDDYASFEVVMRYSNKLKFVALVNKLKAIRALDIETTEDALMLMVDLTSGGTPLKAGILEAAVDDKN